MGRNHPLAKLLRELRTDKGMTLRDVERATNGVVSNAYLWQLEQGTRLEPGPKYLTALAKVYGVPVQTLFEKAGYTDAPTPSEVDVAFQQVLADQTFQFGTRFHGKNLDESSKRVIIELYEKATKKKLLQDGGVGKRQDRPRGRA
jgi:transcriptional regulator with XRE-family HTH domain